MKNIYLSIVLFVSLASYGQELTFMSYNIRYDTKNDKENQWELRKSEVVELIREHSPIAFGVQEALHGQMNFLDSMLTEYSYVGVGRDDGRQGGEYSGIFYKSDVLEVIDESTFWLSLTPHHVSRGWDAALPRICTVARFRHKTTLNHFFFLNTHFDHKGKMARFQSALLISKKLKQINLEGLPVVLTGDFNAMPKQRPILYFSEELNDAATISKSPLEGPIGTFSGFELEAKLKNRIDYIFTKGFEVNSYKHLEQKRSNGLWPSDHLPVLISVLFQN